ncbi:hypothetical protein FRB91_003252 [Serendipita sp. 411]|nr:hypothetical protein FRC19_003383 [Serendipita sp. 401]KAG8843598.1 hypothetical protein FRB91_003252 [Serendipita sp. 411]
MSRTSNGTSTPTGSHGGRPTSNTFRSGLLTLRIFAGRSLALPPGVAMPEIIERALASHQHQITAQPPKQGNSRVRDSVQRKRYWWLPYVVLEFDKNEILVDALGGDISAPSWLYKANLYVDGKREPVLC